ncbi:MAG: hypothetical protein Ta2C_09170 [Candidatus Endomicrobiellum trichonymphae]|uniref:type II CRISPR RNA-guided endonuclease Cas9d n=1 Tax=Endomicrobium trichonymphae TaxID=1408204 RepID=UPI0027D3C609|nr:MAG: hypothetical protein Ta2C_09170 [Candidatus Endomicrobium trichonymphae]
MSENNLIFAFDLGSGSMGVCVRKGEKILCLESLLIDPKFASVENASQLRRQIRTRIAHKKREEWWIEKAKEAGIEVLSTSQPTKENPNLKPDSKMLTEFTLKKSEDKTIYSSHLLRIALLQGVKLEGWQIFKAVWSAIQRRGYDSQLPWAGDAGKKDEKENLDASNEYDKKLKKFFNEKAQYYYPCYYEAYIQDIWDPNKPDDFTKKLDSNPKPARNKDKMDMAVPSRDLVYKELKALLVNAAKYYPKLKGKEDYIIYGPSEKAYASFKNPKYFQYRGKEWDWQGLLGQKVPRFDNRIISKCKLIPRLNVCKANKTLNKEVIFLLELKNMRYALEEGTSIALSHKQINSLFDKYKKNFSTNKNQTNKALINSGKWKQYIQSLGGDVNPDQKEIPQPKLSGKSSFCKPALHILHGLILSGKNPHDYYQELVSANKNIDPLKGLIKEDYKFLLSMPNDWYSISIQDTREEYKNLNKKQALEKIDEIIGSISNRIVRHRLLRLKMKFEELAKEYGEPEKIVFEIAREDFIGKNKKIEYQKIQNRNKKEKEDAIKFLDDAGLLKSSEHILKARLLKRQNCEDIYDTSENRHLSILKLDEYEVDHIVPRARGGSDSLLNFVLTKRKLNAAKSNLTPYEWFHHKERNADWDSYIKNVKDIFGSDKRNNKKIKLLISDKAAELESKKTALQATCYLEKLAQSIAGLYFGFGINTKGDNKKIVFFTGGETANVRSKLELNELLYTNKDEYEKAKQSRLKEKNRKNKRHHALDALVLSILPEIKLNLRKVEKKPDFFDREFCKNEISKVYPRVIKPITPKLRETIYGLRYRLEKNEKTDKFEKSYYFISRFDSSIENFRLLEGKKKSDKCARKNVEDIFDLRIQRDLREKLNSKDLTQEEWEKFLKNYTGNYNKIKKIAVIDSKRFEESEIFNSDGTIKDVIGEYGHKGAIKGQWIKGKEGHRGQIVYKDEKDKWIVIPVYVFESEHIKRKEYENRYKDVKFFRAGQLVELKKDFQDIINQGVYKLRTIMNNGRCKLENINDQTEITKNIEIFLGQCDMTSYDKQ